MRKTAEGKNELSSSKYHGRIEEKACFIGSDPYMGSYRRNGEGDYRCTREEVESMLRDADTGSQDGQIFMDLGTEALDEGTMERYIREYSLWQMKGSFENLL